MNYDIRESNKFLSGVHMGSNVFERFYDEATDYELKNLLKDIKDTFKHHEDLLTEKIISIGGDPTDKLPFGSSFGRFFEEIKLLNADDFTICKEAINAVTMGIIGANEVIHENHDFPSEIKKAIYDIEKDYDNILTKIKILMKKY